MAEKTNILMVCLGNICRSPLAEGIMKTKVNAAEVFVDSAGTGSYHLGCRPDHRAIAVARKNGIDISGQRCRQFSYEDFDRFDRIYAMDRSNYEHILAMARKPAHAGKLRLLLEAIDGNPGEVPDPYYGGDKGFDRVYQLIDEACEAIAHTLENPKKANGK